MATRTLILKKIIYDWGFTTYIPESSEYLDLILLNEFLSHDSGISSKPSRFLEWFLDPTSDCVSSNRIWIEKEGNIIRIGDLLDVDEEKKELLETHACEIPKESFRRMLDRWQELCGLMPDEIVITQDEAGNISMVGKFADGREV